MHTIFKDLESLQSAYTSTFNESSDEFSYGHTSYEGYLQRCKQRNTPQSAIMSEDEWDALQSGDMDPDAFIKDPEDGYDPHELRFGRHSYLNRKEDEESYLAPKTKMTEDEAMEWFSNSDDFHQLFHKFMEHQHYTEKEVNGKQFWVKSK